MELQTGQKYQVKIVLLGDGGVGKSSLVMRFIQDHFEVDYDPTVEESFYKTLSLSGQEVRLQILDTAEQDDFSAIRQSYYREAQGVLCVFDVTQPSSFEKIKLFWGELIEERNMDHKPIPPCVCIGNKVDLIGERVLAEEHVWVRSIGASLLLTSASTGEKVTEVFVEIAQKILESQILCSKQPSERPDEQPKKQPDERIKGKKSRKKQCIIQ